MNEPSNQLPSPALLQILEDLASGKTDVSAAAESIQSGSPESWAEMQVVPGATVDLGRSARCGFGEVIYGEGKSTELMIQIVQTQIAAGQGCLITRIDSTAAAQIRRVFSNTRYNSSARTLRIGCGDESLEPIGAEGHSTHVAVVTAGSTDAAVADEAAETLAWMGIACDRIDDIGVAGPQRLLSAVPRLRTAAAIVVVAGMEGALPAALAGHVATPVVAVPASTGYGANFSGLTPLMGMLISCAANVAVVNIDAGFKGGYFAGLIANSIAAAKSDE
ncbi:nickel pincer cofactor biosynthesis protein LarB [Rhodopirellula sp. JC740]|uniref:Nickel pincer cofactor biosynthesis protein LarB n=1 Tax=Rhodopirellula halodulae TaxID=2894198 RepID=A0ABS8NKG7_9BACT|nr:nickel pincer cofactor biosynthesis protein LarB [Rhodopirellula sp. JC740]MCC9644058.1 nickel pincer cofactor biosynthesis protein LarB [Rhodopirellula sp. JC740]